MVVSQNVLFNLSSWFNKVLKFSVFFSTSALFFQKTLGFTAEVLFVDLFCDREFCTVSKLVCHFGNACTRGLGVWSFCFFCGC